MSKLKSIVCSKNDIIIRMPAGNEEQTLKLEKSQIKYIQLDKCIQKKFLKEFPSEKIEILVSNKEHPLVFYREREKLFFDEYKRNLSVFAKDNKIKFFNMIDL